MYKTFYSDDKPQRFGFFKCWLLLAVLFLGGTLPAKADKIKDNERNYWADKFINKENNVSNINTKWEADNGYAQVTVLAFDNRGSTGDGDKNMWFSQMNVWVGGVNIAYWYTPFGDKNANIKNEPVRRSFVTGAYQNITLLNYPGDNTSEWRPILGQFDGYIRRSTQLYWTQLRYYPALEFENSTGSQNLEVKITDVQGWVEDRDDNPLKLESQSNSLSVTRPFYISTANAEINADGKIGYDFTTDKRVCWITLKFNGNDVPAATNGYMPDGQSWSNSFTGSEADYLNGGTFRFRAKWYPSVAYNENAKVYVYKEITTPKIAVFDTNYGLTATDNGNGTVTLKWKIKNPSSTNGALNRSFKIYRKPNSAGWPADASPIATIDWNSTRTDYEYTYTLSAEEIGQGQKSYYFKVVRDGMEKINTYPANTFFYIEKGVDIGTNYTTPHTLHFDEATRRIYFKVTKGMEPNPFVFSITATQTSTNNAQTVDQTLTEVPANDVYKLQGYDYYFQSGAQGCVPTRYVIQSKVGNALIGAPAEIDVLYQPAGNRRVSSFTASKGYYNNKINLKWTIPVGARDFTGFRIYRSVVGSPASPTQIYEAQYNNENTLEYSNSNVAPGTFYHYQLRGLVQCDTAITETKMAEEFGYAQAFGSAGGKVTFTGTTAGVPGVEIVFENTSENDQSGKNRALEIKSDNGGYFGIPTPYVNNSEAFSLQLWAKLRDKAGNEPHSLFQGVTQTQETRPQAVPATGATVLYGQDANKQPVSWKVLSNTDGKMLLFADQLLAQKPYHSSDVNISWDNSLIRNWMNTASGDGLLASAFTSAEQQSIMSTQVTNSSGANTADKLFLFSSDDLTNYNIPIPTTRPSTSTVSNTNDSGAGSLRQVIASAAEGSTVVIDPALAGQTINLGSSLAIFKNLTIEGNNIVLNGSGCSGRIIAVFGGRTVTVNRVHFADAKAGALYCAETNANVTLNSCIFSNNSITAAGGAIDNEGTLKVYGCTFYGNSAAISGGAISSTNGNLTLTGNLFYGNTSTAAEKGKTVDAAGTVTTSYNVWDDNGGMNIFLGTGDKQITALTFDTGNFVPADASLDILPVLPASFPTTDFYGQARAFPGGKTGAVASDGSQSTGYDDSEKFWWLRNTTGNTAAYVSTWTGVKPQPDPVVNVHYIRPAMTVDLSKVRFLPVGADRYEIEQGTASNVVTVETPKLDISMDSDKKLKLSMFGETLTWETATIRTVGDSVITDSIATDSYFHLTMVMAHDKNSYMVTPYINGNSIGTQTLTSWNSLSFNHAYIGGKTGNHLNGFIDELRLWDVILSTAAIRSNHKRYIPSSEYGLKGYYRFDEPNDVGNNAYDQSQDANTGEFNENHGFIVSASRTNTDIPSSTQLGLKAVTDGSGNYASGLILPYRNAGSNYTITPYLGAHQFSPKNESRTVSGAEPSFNGVDFSDNSKFAYNGVVVYEGGNFPVEGCSFYIDGAQQLNSNNEPVLSRSDGKFELTVPVGTHTIKVVKQGHVFVKDTIFQNFQDDELAYMKRFEDKTRTRLVGRVVGGTIESAKKLGFGESRNNVGAARLVLKADKDYWFVENAKSETVIHFDTLRNNTVQYKEKSNEITIRTNDDTGEFYADVYPEKYSITHIYTDTLLTQRDYLENSRSLDLTNKVTISPETQSYLTRTRNDTIIPNPKFPELITVVEHTDSIAYNDTLVYTHRVAPAMIIRELDESGKPKFLDENKTVPFYGEPDFIYFESSNSQGDTVALARLENGAAHYTFIDANNSTDGYPVYTMNKRYDYLVSLQERYANWQKNGEISDVPVQGGQIQVINEMGPNTGSEYFTLDSLGLYTYSSFVYRPNTSSGLRSIEFNYPCVSATCPNEKITAIVMGGESTGTNFTTQAPDRVLFVLRDPPGDHSKAYWERHNTIEVTTGYNLTQDFSLGASAKLELGNKTSVVQLTGLGVSVGTIADAEFTNDIGGGLTLKETYNKEGRKVSTFTNTIRIETSEDPTWVGPDADVFVGVSTNLLYGYTNMIQLADRTLAEKFESKLFESYDNNYKIGRNSAISIGDKFGTTFHYTQRMIRETLIPEWKAFINNLLTNQNPSPSDIQYPVYHTDLQPGSANYGSLDSYTIIYPSGWNDDDKLKYTDSVQYFNRQIAGWEHTLRLNEQAKVKALERDKFNYSFSDGVSIDYSDLRDTTSSVSLNRGAGFTEKFETHFGLKVLGSGVQMSVEEELSFLGTANQGSSNMSGETQGFVLKLENSDNKITTDIYSGVNIDTIGNKYVNMDSITGSFIFVTRGGQTSCPYEGANSTHYYLPGTILNTATMQNEVPILQVVGQSSVSGVPADGMAVYQIKLLNNSESHVNGWYNLRVNSASNPGSAVVRLDGQVITDNNTVQIYVPYGPTGVTKTVTIERGPIEYQYNNIELVMASKCQYDAMQEGDIYSKVQLSASFLQGCSEIVISQPLEFWVMNAENETGNALPIYVTGFNQNFANLGYIDIQWKDSYSSVWNSLRKYYFNPDAYDEKLGEMYTGTNGQIVYNWDMNTRPDGNYDIRAIAVCIDPVTYLPISQTSAPARAGVKDMLRPELFGRPEPKDGVLDVNDEIMIQFNEPVAGGRIIGGVANNPGNIYVSGIKSEAQGPLSHPASVHFNGTSVINTGNDITLTAPFTVEAWVRLNEQYTDGQKHVIFSHNDNFVLSVYDGYLYVDANNRQSSLEIPVSTPFMPEWAHIAVSYAANGDVSGYYAVGSMPTETLSSNLGAYSQTGRLAVGNAIAGSMGVNADIHDVRVWSSIRTAAEISSNMYDIYNGVENNLKHYYRMDEAQGATATDLAGGLNGTLAGATWTLSHPGKSVTLASGNSLKLPGSRIGLGSNSDFSIELWFKGAAGQSDATLFSAGSGDGMDMGSGQLIYDSSDKLRIFFNSQSRLAVASKGNTYATTTSSYLDNQWHHLAFAVNRLSNATITVDGNLIQTIPSSNIGGMIATDFYVGQRGYFRGNAQMAEDFVLDQPFTGSVDEIRIWNAGLDNAFIKDNKNARVDTISAGLVAYYPFEEYGLQNGSIVTNSSLKDYSQKHSGLASLTSGASISDDYAPVKIEGPNMDLGFRYVVNGDKILITLTEERARIEKSLITVKVEGVQDLNGNKQASAAIWTAYIDQTQLRWSQKQLSLETAPGQTVQQTVAIKNTGGVPQNFTIANIPTWLTVTPSTGTVPAQSSVDIAIKAANGVNVGKYAQTLFLNGLSVDQMDVNLNVRNIAPNWSVNPAEYEQNASIVASLLIDGVYSTDTDDKLAAFVGSECRGVANVTYEPLYGRYVTYLTVYGDELATENFVFRIWDADKSEIRQANTSAALNWANNYSFGSITSPIVFTATDANLQEMPLAQVWTWLSFNTSNADMSVNTVFGEVASKADVLKNHTTLSAINAQNRWEGSLDSINNTEMYKIKMRQPSVLHVAGTPVNPRTTPIRLLNGWNWISYTPQGMLSVQQALAGLLATENDLIKDQASFAIYSNGHWTGSLETMKPGKGYIYQSLSPESKTFTYPYVTPVQASMEFRNSSNSGEIFEPVPPNKYSDNMSIIANVKNKQGIMNNVEVGAFVGEECRGTQISKDNGLIFLSIAGETNGETVKFKVRDISTGNILETVQTIPYANDAVIGSISSPYIINFTSTGNDKFSDGINVYPNPVRDLLQINHSLESIDVLQVLDVSGRVVLEKTDFVEKSLNVSSFPEGVYLLKLIKDGKTMIFKVVKL